MFAPALLMMFTMTMLASAVLAGGLLAARSSISQTAAAYAALEADNAVHSLQAALAAQISDEAAQARASGQWPPVHRFDPPAPTSLFSACARPCDLSTTISWSRAAPGGAVASAFGVQTRFVDENRVAELVSVSVTNSRGEALARRRRFITFRVMDTPPYALVDGQLDSASPFDAPPGSAQGDVAANGSLPIDAAMGCERVDPVLDSSPAANSGLPWGVGVNNHGAHEAVCNRATSPVNQFADLSWTNGNVDNSGWSR